MKIYFEDGELVSTDYLPVNRYIVVNAAHGISQNIEALDYIKKTEPHAYIYTNSIHAVDNRYAWDEHLRVPEVYIRAGEYMVFTRIDKLTNRELREGHNLGKMYIAGEFDGRPKHG